MLVGGGFGGKEDMTVQHHASLVAWLTGKPTKVLFSRQESLNIHPKRHAMEMDITTACDAEGNLVASKVNIISNCGAYASFRWPCTSTCRYTFLWSLSNLITLPLMVFVFTQILFLVVHSVGSA